MTTIEYIKKDIGLSNTQFEAIAQLAELCGMKSLFEAKKRNIGAQFQEAAKVDTPLMKDTRTLIRRICNLAGVKRGIADSMESVARFAVDVNSDDKTRGEKLEQLAEYMKGMSSEEKQHLGRMVTVDMIEQYKDEYPDSPIIGCLTNLLLDVNNMDTSWSNDDAPIGIDEMFDMNTDMSGGVKDDIADVGSNTGIDYDFTNPEKSDYEPQTRKESQLQKGTRDIIGMLCRFAGVDRNTTADMENTASIAVDPNDAANADSMEKLKNFLKGMSDEEKQNAYGTEMIDFIDQYKEEYPDSPIIAYLATFHTDVNDAHKRQRSDVRNAVDDLLKSLYTDEKGQVMPEQEIKKKQKADRLSRVRNNRAISSASVGFGDREEGESLLDELSAN